jgi:hypothetical protein
MISKLKQIYHELISKKTTLITSRAYKLQAEHINISITCQFNMSRENNIQATVLHAFIIIGSIHEQMVNAQHVESAQ